MESTGLVKRMAAQFDSVVQLAQKSSMPAPNPSFPPPEVVQQLPSNHPVKVIINQLPTSSNEVTHAEAVAGHSWIRLQVGEAFDNLGTNINQFFDEFVSCAHENGFDLSDKPLLAIVTTTAIDALRKVQAALSSFSYKPKYLFVIDGIQHESTVRKTLVKALGDLLIIFTIYDKKAASCLQGQPGASKNMKQLVWLASQFTIRSGSKANRQASEPLPQRDNAPPNHRAEGQRHQPHPKSASHVNEQRQQPLPARLSASIDSPLNQGMKGNAPTRSSMTAIQQDFVPRDYVKVEKLGEGAFGIVFKCCDKDTLRMFVAKESIYRRSDVLAIAQNEIDRIKDLDHPKIIKYYGCVSEADQVVIFMEYLSGGSVKQAMDKCGGPIIEKTAINYIEQVVEGLAYIHSEGIIHGDLKCDNLLLDGHGGIKLGDFGIALKKNIDSLNQSFFSKTSFGGGTFYWLAPEIHNQQVFGRSADMWSLGCTIVEMLTEKPPYCNLTTPAFFSRLGGNQLSYNPKELVPNISSHMAAFLSRLLVIDPKKRLHTGMEASETFRTVFHQE